ncbi:hypothetical protein [Xanthomonas pisi]|uniref:Uncharacterized protein n=1 Tax=Xanthomonas pisi TaxID=56457 RepID=A0A2S7D4U6_9XANT|nr:hypothetical protein [Xanthomonas pisi]PPU68754.1 hypothetical protein XpiCFBP4643_09710 [Xanthomonas pisi]
MNVTDRIKRERGLDTIAGILPRSVGASATEVAAHFCLSESSDCYEEIDAAEAAKVLESVLHRYMTYNVEVMPLKLALELSAQFMAEFSDRSTKFFTNGDWGRKRGDNAWFPATSSTFDAGVIAVSDQKMGCVWCTDED